MLLQMLLKNYNQQRLRINNKFDYHALGFYKILRFLPFFCLIRKYINVHVQFKIYF